MEINLLLPNLDDDFNKYISIAVWSSLSFTLSITPRDAIRVYSAVRKEVSPPKYLVPSNQLYKLIRSDSKIVTLFNKAHTVLNKKSQTIYFDKRGSIDVENVPKTIRNNKGQFIPNPQYDYQEIKIKWDSKTIVKTVNGKQIPRPPFIKCSYYQSVICKLSENKTPKLVRLCRNRSNLDNDILVDWLMNLTNITQKEISELIIRYDPNKARKLSNNPAQHFSFKHKEYSGLVLGDGTNLYWLSCPNEALTEISQNVNNRKSMILKKDADNAYVMGKHSFALVSSTTNVLADVLKISSRKTTNLGD